MPRNDSEKYLWLAAGAALGTSIALLFTPRSGAYTRALIGTRARSSTTDLFDRGRELYEKGRLIADEAAELFEQGRKLVEEVPERENDES